MQINNLLASAAALGESGEVDAAEMATRDAEQLQMQRTVFERQVR
jgi:hypothetical protein